MQKKNFTLLIPMYNKSKYIERMVKSLARQTYIDRTEIIVMDDCSSDGSFEELERCANRYSVPMEVFFHEKNLGFAQTIIDLYAQLHTEFFSVLDPDDYYIDPRKIERSVKFLESNPDFATYGCNYIHEFEDGSYQLALPENTPNFASTNYEDFCTLQTSATTFRNFITPELIAYLRELIGNRRWAFCEGDMFRNFCAIHFGRMRFENFIGSSYYQTGVWSETSELEQSILNCYGLYDMALFTLNFLHDSRLAERCRKISLGFYFAAVKNLNEFMDQFPVQNFTTQKYFFEYTQSESNDIVSVFKVLSELHEKLSELKVN